jgi:DNA helicase II / ATP-dependent DNA helicase PcrA
MRMNIGLQDIVILVRSASLTLPIEQALQRAQVRYKLANARKFLDRPHIRPLIAYLKVVHDERTSALLDIVNVPPRRFGKGSADSLVVEAQRLGITLWQALKRVSRGALALGKTKDPKLNMQLALLVRIVETARTMLVNDETMSMQTLLEHLLKGIGYIKYIKETFKDDFEERYADIEEFKETVDVLAQEQDQLPETEVESNDLRLTPLDRLLSSLSLTSGSDSEENQEQVIISTIHNAKGLEWPVVCIPGVYHGSMPSSRAEQDDAADEERRLLYVAMTRAKALLYMTWPKRSARGENVNLSAFLADSKIARLLQSRGPRLDELALSATASVLSRTMPVGVMEPSEDIYVETFESDENRKRPLSNSENNTLPGMRELQYYEIHPLRRSGSLLELSLASTNHPERFLDLVRSIYLCGTFRR